MKDIFGASVTDRLYNYAITLRFTPEAAAAIAATIALEGSPELIPYLGERQQKYLDWAYSKDMDHRMPDTKTRYIFVEMYSNPDFNWGKLKKASTTTDAVRIFNEDYLNKTLSVVDLYTITTLANEINKLYVSNDYTT